MEEQQDRRNAGEKEGGQPSSDSCQTGPEPKEHRIDMGISPGVKNRIRSVQNAKERTQSRTQWPRITKVPHILRGTQEFKKFYKPMVVSIGPYHRGKPDLHPVEMIKPLCAQNFLADSNQDIEALYKKIETNIEAVRNCYDKRPTNRYDNEALAWIMLLDGCFLLQFIRSTVDSSTDDRSTDDRSTDDRSTDDRSTDDCRTDDRSTNDHGTVDMRKYLRDHQISFVEQDLFLLENQLPFGVLKLIFEGAKFNNGSRMEELIKKFVKDTAMPEGSSSEIKLEKHSHLLDLLRSALLGQSEPKQEQQPEKNGKSSSSQGGDGGFCCPWKKGKQQDNWPSFRHIKELKAAGIHLRPSGTSSLRDISFDSCFFYGCLKLPPIIIDDGTKPRFLNIVAYEMCPDAPNDYAVTSYICFLYDLIDHAADVKELRSKHILYNCLGSDEDVAQLFNEIANDLVDPDIYGCVKDDIQKHYDKRLYTWIAEGLHDHFRSPWTILAFFAAILILLFTGFQTYYALPGKS